MNNLKHFIFWCQKVLPLVYDDSLSYYEVLCKVVDYTNKIIDDNKTIATILGQQDIDITQIKKDTLYLSNELEKVKKGDYVSLYIDSLSQWIDKNLENMVSKVAKIVYFGLSDDGYFLAYIPESWSEISFDTTEQGELILTY